MHREVKYYVNGHTAKGFVNFIDSNVHELKNIVTLNHPSNIVKSTILKKVISISSSNDNVEVISSPQSNDYLDGVIVRNRSFAVLNKNIQVKGNEVFDLTKYIPVQEKHLDLEASIQMSYLFKEAYECFKQGLIIHDDLEKVYINEMDFSKADKVAEAFISRLFKDVEPQKNTSIVYERLFGTNTPDGVTNHVKTLIEPIKHRVYIKGRAGTGKSVFMRNVLRACKRYGFDVELYRCSFDPNSIDMLIIRDLDYCLFDSTPPHEFFPTRDSDEVIDLYEEAVASGTDEKYASKIAQLTNAYKAEMKKGLNKLKETKRLDDQREAYWRQAELKNVDEITEQIMNNV